MAQGEPSDRDRQRRRRSLAMALVLALLAILFYVTALVWLGGNIANRPL